MKKWIGLAAVMVLGFILLRPAFAQATHGINWSWNADTTDTAGNTITVDGYNLYCAAAQTGPFTTKANSALITTTSFLETGLTVGNTYYCQLTAVKGALESAHSSTSAGVTFLFSPSSPSTPQGVVQ